MCNQPKPPAEIEKLLAEYEHEFEVVERTNSIPKWNFWLRGCQDFCKIIRTLQKDNAAMRQAIENEVAKCAPYMNDADQERHDRLTKVLYSISDQ